MDCDLDNSSPETVALCPPAALAPYVEIFSGEAGGRR